MTSAGKKAWSADEFTAQLRAVGAEAYHDRHPFHQRMNAGALARDELRAWVANRFYYQQCIPLKDAALLSRCPDRRVRRVWVRRILDHDGHGEDPGGIEKWLRLGEAVGLARDVLEEERMLLPGVRFAVDAYVRFVQTRPWIEGVASSLTELFAPTLMQARLAAFERHYPWIDRAGLAYFRSRLRQAPRDSDEALGIVLETCTERAHQERAVAALRFKCEVLTAQLDALQHHCESLESAREPGAS
jgi:pyrroloquinoline-quinone synthase